MKITKRQLKRIIKKTLAESVPDPAWRTAEFHDPIWKKWGQEGLRTHTGEPPEDREEYDAGYQDGLDGVPPAGNATLAYDAGYDDGVGDSSLPEPVIREAGQSGMGGKRGRQSAKKEIAAFNRFDRVAPDPMASKLEELINNWITQSVTVELGSDTQWGTTYMIKGVDPASVPEVVEEVEDMGGTVLAELPAMGLVDLNVEIRR
jgi:hypothetical protein